jgi:hypothetical protein
MLLATLDLSPPQEPAMHYERREILSLDVWGRFDLASADLVRARRALREGRGTQERVEQILADLSDLQLELDRLGYAAHEPEG